MNSHKYAILENYQASRCWLEGHSKMCKGAISDNFILLPFLLFFHASLALFARRIAVAGFFYT